MNLKLWKLKENWEKYSVDHLLNTVLILISTIILNANIDNLMNGFGFGDTSKEFYISFTSGIAMGDNFVMIGLIICLIIWYSGLFGIFSITSNMITRIYGKRLKNGMLSSIRRTSLKKEIDDSIKKGILISITNLSITTLLGNKILQNQIEILNSDIIKIIITVIIVISMNLILSINIHIIGVKNLKTNKNIFKISKKLVERFIKEGSEILMAVLMLLNFIISIEIVSADINMMYIILIGIVGTVGNILYVRKNADKIDTI